VMTLLVAGLFGILESLADDFLSKASHTESIAVEMAITLVVVFVVRYFHEHIEHFIEELVFAARNRRIRLIESISDSLSAASKPEDVSATLVRRLREDAAIPSAVYVEEGGVLRHDAGDTALDPNDANDVHTFPLETFKRERGKLVCRLPGDDEFAPDEAQALRGLARDAAIARESTRVDALAAELEVAKAALASLNRAEPPVPGRPSSPPLPSP
jgi:hypothetical protein